MNDKCSECKHPVTYKIGLCEKCYGELFEDAKESNEIGYKEKL